MFLLENNKFSADFYIQNIHYLKFVNLIRFLFELFGSIKQSYYLCAQEIRETRQLASA